MYCGNAQKAHLVKSLIYGTCKEIPESEEAELRLKIHAEKVPAGIWDWEDRLLEC